MVAFVINRKTGEEKVVDSYKDPKDNPLGATATILAKIIFEQRINQYKRSQCSGK